MTKQFQIKDVRIINWVAPGKQWWDKVEKHPDEPLIEAVIHFTLSHTEYHKLLDKDRKEEICIE